MDLQTLPAACSGPKETQWSSQGQNAREQASSSPLLPNDSCPSMPCPSHIHTWGSFTCSLSLLLYLKIILFIFILFGYAVSSLLHSFSLSCGVGGLLSSCNAWDSHCSGFFSCRAWDVGHVGFSSCGSWDLEHKLSSCGAWA